MEYVLIVALIVSSSPDRVALTSQTMASRVSCEAAAAQLVGPNPGLGSGRVSLAAWCVEK